MSENTQNVSVDHGGESFFTDSIAIMHGPTKFIVDFKQSTPRIDQVGGDQQQTLNITHNSVIMDPQTAKVLLNILKDNIKKFEEKNGEIELPEKDEKKDMSTERDYIG